MLSQDDMERERYLARMRVLMDDKSRLHSAREEGLEQGLVIESLVNLPSCRNDCCKTLSSSSFQVSS